MRPSYTHMKGTPLSMMAQHPSGERQLTRDKYIKAEEHAVLSIGTAMK